jgi:hypothetical protein
MTNVIELRAFRQWPSKGPAQAPRAAVAFPLEAAFLPFTLWRGAAAFWLSLWMAPLGFRVEALDWPDRLPAAALQPQDRRGPASQLGPVRRR